MNRRSGGTRGSEDDAILSTSSSLPLAYSPPAYTLPYAKPSISSTPPAAIPSSTHTQFTTTATAFASASNNMNEAPPASTSTTTIPVVINVPSSVPQGFTEQRDHSGWDGMRNGLKGGVVVVVVIAMAAIIFFSFWFCCGGRARWKKNSSDGESGGRVLPLHAIRNRSIGHQSNPGAAQATGDAPPRYEEVVPVAHQRLAGGMSHVREEDDGMIADGKTPLSEIPFEDVVLDHARTITPESSSNQSFHMRHHNGIGDTTGHTNS